VPWTRREFLVGSAGLLAGACTSHKSAPAPANNAAPNLPAATTGAFGQFDHLVVLMMENRSFDNMLGYLYQPGQVPRGQSFDGVAGKQLSNPGPDGPVPVTPGTVMDDPNPDPGEEYPHINTDLFGTVDPPSNALKAVADMAAPFNTPNPIPAPAPMNGFVKDYVNYFTYSQGRPPTYAEYSIIMNCFPPDAVPVISTLAKGFAVADHWHCEVPSQTFCNRSFFHAATSSGFTNNEPYKQFPLYNDATTVFDRLDKGNVPWRIYFDPQDGFSMTYLIHFRRLWDRLGSNIRFMDQFLDDVRTGALPSYSFVEPRLMLNHNDEHPPGPFLGKFRNSNVLAGEQLIADVYNAIRTSSSSKGSNWRNTALLIVYDEGGGCYDHVPPPTAPPPEPSAPPGEEDFRFDRLGERVPAVLISAHTQAGTVVNAPMRHTAVIRTMSEKWGLSPLTDRDRTAPTLGPFFNRSTPRPVADWPTVHPRPIPPGIDYAAEPLNELQRAFIGAADAAVGPPSPAAANAQTVGDAMAFLRQKYGLPR
jgi:phospholipase C